MGDVGKEDRLYDEKTLVYALVASGLSPSTNLDDAATAPHAGDSCVVQVPANLLYETDVQVGDLEVRNARKLTSLAVSRMRMKPCV